MTSVMTTAPKGEKLNAANLREVIREALKAGIDLAHSDVRVKLNWKGQITEITIASA